MGFCLLHGAALTAHGTPPLHMPSTGVLRSLLLTDVIARILRIGERQSLRPTAAHSVLPHR